MVIDKFGRTAPAGNHTKTLWKHFTFGYVLTVNGDIDVQSKRICNLNLDPTENADATSKQYVDTKLLASQQEFRKTAYNSNKRFHELTNKINELEKNIIESANKLVKDDIQNRVKKLEEANLLERLNRVERNQKIRKSKQDNKLEKNDSQTQSQKLDQENLLEDPNKVETNQKTKKKKTDTSSAAIN